MKQTILVTVFFLICFVHTHAQNKAVDTGKVDLVQDYKVKSLLNKHIEVNAKSAIKGYRVKIHFGADKNKANEIKAKFSTLYPDVPAYAKYDQPNFNIRVGDFRSKLEAYKFLKEIQIEFPSAFIVQDDIEFPRLDVVEKK
ncbi:MAG: hypothetical protein A3F72_20780 [Bacteroidetes bacterium RIFCSPLOWO2_12_FULL_35_15]|nr:MAG: hypothetical protein A3F72_20780 [Bacteroidetes bacterium RIFCSPLOWO2_12_FULL_35_15]